MSLSSKIIELVQVISADIKLLFNRSLPEGGSTGQVLAKVNNANFNANWINPPASGDSGTIGKTVSIDFGILGKRTTTTVVSDPLALTTSKIIISEKLNDTFEAEMDPIVFSAYCPSNGTVTIVASGVIGSVSGIREANYILT